MWSLIIVIFYYHGPAMSEVPGFVSQQACETAAVQVNKKWTIDEWKLGSKSYASSTCVKKD